MVHFQGPSFDPDLFWARLVSLLSAGCPIGCGTSAMTLEELGLVGQHAYSVLDAEDGDGVFIDRRVKVRNPWGEWTRREQDELLAQLGVAITPGRPPMISQVDVGLPQSYCDPNVLQW